MNKVIVKVTGCYNCPFARDIKKSKYFEDEKLQEFTCAHPVMVNPDILELPRAFMRGAPAWCPLRSNEIRVIFDGQKPEGQIDSNVWIIPEEKSNV